MFYTEILKQSTKNVGANFITQINHKNDPVANGWLNKDASYIPSTLWLWKDLHNYHPFKTYYLDIRPYINKELKNE